MSELRNFEKDVIINKYKLDDECIKHCGIYYFYTKELSDTKALLDCEKDKLDFMESEFELIIRKEDKTYEGVKITEGSIKAFLKSDSKLKKQREKINEIKKSIYHLESAVKALEHKKSMISHLVTLFTMRYYSEPKDEDKSGISKDIRESMNINGRRRKKNDI